ncbi:MAG: LPS export ABC transporter periplasmic protein LptC [Thermodesulfobacteriota bacterium]
MNVKRNSVWLLPLLVILSGPLWWPTVADLLKPRGSFDTPAPPSSSQLKTFVLDEVLLIQNRDGHDEFVLKAAKINNGIHDDLLELEEIEVQLLDGDGRPTVLTGGEAFYHTDQQIITIIDNVRLRTPDGQEMRTEALRYLTKYRKIKTAEDIWLADEKARVAGGNMFYDLVDGNFRVGGGVRVDLY